MIPRTAIIGIALAAALTGFAQKPSAQKPDSGLVATFAEEFAGHELDLAHWVPHDPFGSAHTPAKAELSAGQLHLTGTISTFGLFSQIYGRFEIRFRLPTEKRSRVRVRLLPERLATQPAINLFETAASSARIHFANYWGTEQTERSYGDWFDAPDLSTAFHTIAIDWGRDKIVWSIDGKEKFRSVDGIPQQPMFLEIENEAPAAALDIDFVRVYLGR